MRAAESRMRGSNFSLLNFALHLRHKQKFDGVKFGGSDSSYLDYHSELDTYSCNFFRTITVKITSKYTDRFS